MRWPIFGGMVLVLGLVGGGCAEGRRVLDTQSGVAQGPIRVVARDAAGKPRVLEPHELHEHEAELLHRLSEPGAPMEALAIRRTGAWTGDMGLVQVLIWPQRAILRYHVSGQGDCWYHRDLTPAETAELRQYLRDHRIDALPAYEPMVLDGEWYNLFHVRQGLAIRLHINNPFANDDLPVPHSSPHQELLRYLDRLTGREALPVTYRLGVLPKGAEILFASATDEAVSVWAMGEDVRVRLRPRFTTSDLPWRALHGGRCGSEVPAPYAESWPERPSRDDLGLGEVWSNNWDQARWGEKYICNGTLDWKSRKTWICQKGKEPEVLFEQPLADYAVTPSGLLVGTLEELLIYDLTRKQRIAIEKPGQLRGFSVALLIPTTHKVLLERSSPRAASYPEFILLDPATGKHARVDPRAAEAVWHACQATRMRIPPLQPTTRPGRVWAAQVGSSREHGSLIGQLEPETMTFDWTQVQGIRVDSSGMWVDESTRSIYLIHNGHVLRMPIPRRPATLPGK